MMGSTSKAKPKPSAGASRQPVRRQSQHHHQPPSAPDAAMPGIALTNKGAAPTGPSSSAGTTWVPLPASLSAAPTTTMTTTTTSPNAPPPAAPAPAQPRAPAQAQTPAADGEAAAARPPVSPLTPPLRPSSPRRNITHAQPDQVGIPPPAPVLLSLEENPDAIALRSAISILQMQRQRAMVDMQALERIKDEALADPGAFARDLASGKVSAKQDPLFGAGGDMDSDSDSDSDEGGGERGRGEGEPGRAEKERAPAWTQLPRPQNVVRCPPINWSQYAVVGESLDKIHADQVARPPEGVPATIGAGGVYEFKGEPPDAARRRHVGVAAPYAPGTDRIDRKPKAPKK